jgi:hypothetical protein
VAIAVDYNADNLLPTAMNQIEAMHFSGGGIPSKGFSFNAKTRLMNKADPKYVRTGAPPAGDDLRLFDGGNLYFATSGCTNTTQIGKLEVTYRFEMGLPTLLNQGGGGLTDTAAASFNDAAPIAGGLTTVAYSPPMAVALGNNAFVNTAGSIVPPTGNYLVTWWTRNTFTGSATQVTAGLFKNGVAVPAVVPLAAFTAATQTQVNLSQSVLVSANGTDAFTIDNVATYSTGTNNVAANIVFVPV